MPSPSQYTQQQNTHIPSAVSAPNFYNNGNISPLRKPSPIRRTQSFEVDEADLKHIKRRISQTQINSPNLPRVQNRASRSNSSTNISPPQRQQGASSPDYRARSLSNRGSSPSRSTSPSRKTMVNTITRPDTNLAKAICATLTATNKTTETLAIELGDRSLLPEVNMFLSGAERADGWDQVEKLLIDWMILQPTSGGAPSLAQVPTSGPINHQAAIITSPKQNPVVSASPGKSDHWTADSEEAVATKYFPGNQMNSSQNPYYSTTQGNWANSAQIKQAQQYVDHYRNGPHVNQNGYREAIQHNTQINNFPRSPEKNSAQQIPMQKQQYMNGSPREEERTQFAPPSWQTQNRPIPNPQPIFSSPRDQNGGPAEKQYSASTTSANGFSANNMYINQQLHKMPQSQAPHLQQPAPHQHHANLAPHQRLGANFEGNYQNEQSMSQLTIAESPHNGRVNPFYNYDNAYSYEYSPYEGHETHQQPQSIVNSNQSPVMRRY
eukprot:TRINITY_DN13105_c0_g1_i1.p1 TRINITY_DN13105_c0_g1~~TRINITY_DN13105_c0_g1_i1.p1  ORF type:complete len:537 (-),score=12.31 TRINITY_DN13105_c0_g1_i1:78-1559(-)